MDILPEDPKTLWTDVADIEQGKIRIVIRRGPHLVDPVEGGLREPGVGSALGEQSLDGVEIEGENGGGVVLDDHGKGP